MSVTLPPAQNVVGPPAVMEAAVVARPDPRWGETPCAFVTLKPGATATAEDVVSFLRDTIARTEITKLRSSGLSLMPEGLESGMSEQDLADLIDYVRAAKGSKTP